MCVLYKHFKGIKVQFFINAIYSSLLLCSLYFVRLTKLRRHEKTFPQLPSYDNLFMGNI